MLYLSILLAICIQAHQETIIEEKDANALYGEISAADDPKIYYMSITTNVMNRFATTLITCRIKNPSVVSKEATFSIILPDKAFISKFVMEINNKTYQSYVKEKQEAQHIYDAAVAKGESAGQVKVSARNSKRFSVNVNLEAEGKGVFYLTYEELLVRTRGKYDIVLNVYPGQPVKNLRMEVKINETQPLKFVNSPVLKPSGRLDAKQIMPRVNLENLPTSAYVRYNPDVSEQRRVARSLETGEKYGLAAQFVVQYDVDRRSPGGQVIQTKNHFAQYYAPDNVTVLPKYVIFILDTSGSMVGTKLDQLKEALKNILLKLRPEDSFNIINFSDRADAWNVTQGDVTYVKRYLPYHGYDGKDLDPNHNMVPPAHPAVRENIERALQIVDLLESLYETDIFNALLTGFTLLENNFKDIKGAQPLFLFLTDGESNLGIQNEDLIINNITAMNSYKAGIYTLSLGEEVNKDFLNKLSSKNQGHTTHIYEDSDISLQIEKFFETLSSPALKNITFNLGPNVTQVTQTQFPTAFIGSELIVVGEKPEDTDLSRFQNLSISGDTRTGPVKLKPDVETRTVNMERLWAYAKVRQLLAKRKLVEDKAAITKKALDLALKYSFVTEVTSLVVVKPKDEDVVNPQDADLDSDINEFGASTTRPMQVYPSVPPRPLNEYPITQGPPQVAYTQTTTTRVAYTRVTFRTERPTPPRTPPPPATSFTSTTENYFPGDFAVTKEPRNVTIEIQNVNFIKMAIPWMEEYLLNNGTLHRYNGDIHLDVSSDPYQSGECQYQIKGVIGNGNCTRLHECEVQFQYITDSSKLDSFLCSLKEKWGICCS